MIGNELVQFQAYTYSLHKLDMRSFFIKSILSFFSATYVYSFDCIDKVKSYLADYVLSFFLA